MRPSGHGEPAAGLRGQGIAAPWPGHLPDVSVHMLKKETLMSQTLPPSSTLSAPARPRHVELASGLALCLVIAVAALGLGQLAPVIGAPIIAILIGVAVANIAGPRRLIGLRIKEVSGYALRTGIVILGATLSLRDVASSGAASLPLLALTVTLGLAFPLLVGPSLGVHWRMRSRLGIAPPLPGAPPTAPPPPVLRATTR